MIIISNIPVSKKIYKYLFSTCIILRPAMLSIFGCIILPYITGMYNTHNIFYIMCSIMFSIMILSSCIQIPLQTSFQSKTPDRIRGRFFSIFSTGMAYSVPLGNTIVGFIIDHLHFSTIIISIGIIEVAMVIALVLLIDFNDFFSYADK